MTALTDKVDEKLTTEYSVPRTPTKINAKEGVEITSPNTDSSLAPTDDEPTQDDVNAAMAQIDLSIGDDEGCVLTMGTLHCCTHLLIWGRLLPSQVQM